MDTDQVKANGSVALTQSWAVTWRKRDRVQSYFLGKTGLILCPVGGWGLEPLLDEPEKGEFRRWSRGSGPG